MQLRILRAAALAAALSLTFTACGSAASASSEAEPTPEPTPVSDTFKLSTEYDYSSFRFSDSLTDEGLWEGVTALDYVTLPEDYAAIPLSEADVTPTEEDIDTAVNQVVSQYTTAELGDTVNIDYVGSVDGVEFTGGNTYGQGTDLTLGSGAYITGFEDQIVGHKSGESFDITVTFPDGYSDSTDAEGNTIQLSGADAVFSITINSITKAEAITDEWVEENLLDAYSVETVEQLRAYLQNRLRINGIENAALDYLMNNSSFADEMPETVLDYTVCQFLSYYEGYAEYNGVTLEDFVVNTIHCESVDDLMAQSEDSIIQAVKETLVYQAVAEAAGITLDTELAAQYASYAESYGDPYVNQFVLDRQVLNYLRENAVIS